MTTATTFYDFSEKEYKRLFNNIKSFIQNPKIQKDDLHISDPLLLIFAPQMIHNPFTTIAKEQKSPPQLHADTVNSYLQLLKTKANHIFLTTHYLNNYDCDITDIKTKPKEYILKKRLDHLAIFLKDYGARKNSKVSQQDKDLRQQLLDDVIDTIETYYNPSSASASKKRKTTTTPTTPLIFFPIYLDENHFALAVLDIHKPQPDITYYDSLLFGINRKPLTTEPPMTEQADKYMNLIVELLSNYFFNYKDTTYRSLHPNATHFFRNIHNLDIIQLDPLCPFNEKTPGPFMPQQKNGVDCGVYVCALAYLIANNYKIPSSFTEEQIQNIRLRIKQLIFSFSPYFPRDVDYEDDDDPFIVTTPH
jgi:hypothetical protein